MVCKRISHGEYMRRFILLLLLFNLASFSSLNALNTFKGQKIYLKQCRVCHMGSKIFLNMHTLPEWEEMLRHGWTLADIHLSKDVKNVNSKDGTIKDSHSYFKSDKYLKEFNHLKSFIIEFSRKRNKNFYNQ